MIISLVCGERSLQHKVAGLQHEATDCTSNPRQGNLRYKRVEKILLLEHILDDFQADCIPAGLLTLSGYRKSLICVPQNAESSFSGTIAAKTEENAGQIKETVGGFVSGSMKRAC